MVSLKSGYVREVVVGRSHVRPEVRVNAADAGGEMRREMRLDTAPARGKMRYRNVRGPGTPSPRGMAWTRFSRQCYFRYAAEQEAGQGKRGRSFPNFNVLGKSTH